MAKPVHKKLYTNSRDARSESVHLKRKTATQSQTENVGLYCAVMWIMSYGISLGWSYLVRHHKYVC